MAEQRRLRVVFDAHAISPHRSGIGEYSARLLGAMLRNEQHRVDLHVYVPSGIHPVRDEEELLTLTSDVADGDLYRPQHQWRLPRLLREGSYDLLHSPDFFVPLRSPVPVVCTIHDLIPLVHPSYIRKSIKVRLLPLFRAWVRHALRRSARVITVSEHSRDDMRRLFPGVTAHIDAIHLAPTVEVSGAPLPPRLADGLAGERTLLYVGRHDPYKGIGHFLRAFARARSEGGLDGIRIAVTGQPDARYDITGELRRLGLERDVRLLGYVDPADLSPLYAHAMALVLPSLYEGFGLPVLDAMRHGTPVLCSDRGSLPEVAGGAALLFDPESEEGFARTLKDFAENTMLQDDLVKHGYERSLQFSWNHTAMKTVESYLRASG